VHDLTVLTLVPRASDRLARCLESVQWADARLCVVDARAEGDALAQCEALNARAAVRHYENAADQRNWALPQIETEWTLVLDADEWVSDALRTRIGEILRDPASLDGYDIRRASFFLGRLIRHCGWQRDYNLRLFRTRAGRYLERRVHSKVVVDGPTGRIDAVMYHDTYRSFDEYFRTALRFTQWGAEDAFERGKRAGAGDLLVRPLAKFLKMYVLRMGFRDGWHGFVLCTFSAFGVFLKYARIWDMGRRGLAVSREGAPPELPPRP
jgi:hypothetical protein